MNTPRKRQWQAVRFKRVRRHKGLAPLRVRNVNAAIRSECQRMTEEVEQHNIECRAGDEIQPAMLAQYLRIVTNREREACGLGFTAAKRAEGRPFGTPKFTALLVKRVAKGRPPRVGRITGHAARMVFEDIRSVDYAFGSVPKDGA